MRHSPVRLDETQHLTFSQVSLRGSPFGPKQSPSAESEIASVAALLRNDDFAAAPNPRDVTLLEGSDCDIMSAGSAKNLWDIQVLDASPDRSSSSPVWDAYAKEFRTIMSWKRREENR